MNRAYDAQSTLSHLNTLGGSPFASARVLHAGGTAPDRHHAQPGSPSHAACVLYRAAHPAPPDGWKTTPLPFSGLPATPSLRSSEQRDQNSSDDRAAAYASRSSVTVACANSRVHLYCPSFCRGPFGGPSGLVK